MDRPKAGGIGEHPGDPAAGAQVGIRVYVCMCACACVHVCVFRDLRVFFPRGWAGKGKKLLISKGVGLYQANWNGVPPSIHQEPEEGEKMCDRDWSCPLLYLQCVARGQAQCLCPEMLLNSSGIGSRNLNHLNKGPRGL